MCGSRENRQQRREGYQIEHLSEQCVTDGGHSDPMGKDQSSGKQILREKVVNLPTSKRYILIVLLYPLAIAGIMISSVFVESMTETVQFILSCLNLFLQLGLSATVLAHCRETRQECNWPRYHGLQYAIPFLTIVTVPLFIWMRAEIQRYGATPFKRNLIYPNNIKKSVYSIYKTLGVGVTTLVILSYLFTVPVSTISDGSEGLEAGLGIITCFILGGVLAYRRFAPSEQRQHVDIAIRDLVVRIGGITGLAVVSTLTIFVLVFPLSIIVGIPASVLDVFFTLDLAAILEATSTSLFALLLIPLAAVFVLILRAFPWINSVLILSTDAISYIVDTITNFKSSDEFDEPKNSPDASTVEILPQSGFHYTSVNIEETASVDMAGYYGYKPRQIQDVDTSGLPSSLRYGILFSLPGLLVASLLTAYYTLRPEQAAEWAQVLPGDNVLIAILSFIGIPRVVVDNAIELAGLPPEVISLGVFGVILPTVLMIPGAWHLVIEYESLLYRTLQRIGGSNHVLFLWVLPFILPFILGWWKVKNTVRNWLKSEPTSTAES